MPKPHPDVWRVEIVVALAAVEAFEAVLENFTDSVSWFLDDPDADETDENLLWRLEGYSRTPVERAEIEAALEVTAAAIGREAPALRVEQVPGTDWVTANLQAFPPITAGRFFVHGSHFEGKPPAGKIAIKIDAGTAFGSGEHATTYGCLMALDRLLRRRTFRHPLDLGCGSGILGIAAAKSIHVPVTLSDIDPVSVQVATRNARRNGVASLATAFLSDGYNSRGIRSRRPYDLILANILARPLAAMAADLSRHLAPDGVAVLSGLLNRQERFVLGAHRAQGLSLLGKIRMNGWTALVIGRTPRARM
ncbi:MAG TPA: 50S ribosomal protein L11 methyltransferase [Candidatus Sulfotelmatobacter sp.]|jgi:ribosomal protein L11 methyltransferase|nr:50S ribosomal protein L11 methyltransferase [Candidatus Sulfotelmatobacter sp.]